MPYADLQSMHAKATRRRHVNAYHARLRVKTLMFHGGKCEHCGFADMRALQLDHVHGGGNRERKRSGDNSHTIVYAGLRRPFDFQVLCANCNWIKRYEKDETGRLYTDTARRV